MLAESDNERHGCPADKDHSRRGYLTDSHPNRLWLVCESRVLGSAEPPTLGHKICNREVGRAPDGTRPVTVRTVAYLPVSRAASLLHKRNSPMPISNQPRLNSAEPIQKFV